MSLRRQLLAVSLLLLALPWAGCQFVREMEGALRSGQARAVAAGARAVAASLRDEPGALAVGEGPRPMAGAASLYAHPGPPVIVDGYGDDWGEQPRRAFPGTDGFGAQIGVRERGARLYLLLEVRDPTPTFHDPLRPVENGDRVRLRFGADGRREVLVSTAAPGRVRGRPRNSSLSLLDARRVRGSWQDTADGYRVELDLPLGLLQDRLGFEVVDAHAGGDRTAVGNLDRGPAPVLVRRVAALDNRLARFADAGSRVEVIDPRHYVAGAAAGPAVVAGGGGETFWALRALYRAMLAERPALPPPAVSGGRLIAPEIDAALAGRVATRWYRGGEGGALVAAAAPLLEGSRVAGAVRLSQDSEQYLALADAATGRVLALSLAVTGVAVLALLAWASYLSLRIARLGRAAAAVVDERGQVAGAFPRSAARDEVGDLSRRFAGLLDTIAGYNDYLGKLARRLGHELRTPIAVIQSSLDNLEGDALSPEEQATYLRRAREGLARLARILAAMGEASRLEDSLRGVEKETVALAPLLREVAAAYGDSHPDHDVKFIADPAAAGARADANPDLLVQALDKLVDNAASFAPPGSTIDISLERAGNRWAVAVSNPGPTLPTSLRGQLFEPMVSLRQGDGSTHLGLGLHIVRLIAEELGGSVAAADRAGGDGAVFTLFLPALSDEASPGTPAA